MLLRGVVFLVLVGVLVVVMLSLLRRTPKRARAIEASSDDHGSRICVRDNGIGIDRRYADQIFELGLKLDKSRGGGPGYGLYLARRVAEEHGGSISVDSAPDQGSTFCITVPGR